MKNLTEKYGRVFSCAVQKDADFELIVATVSGTGQPLYITDLIHIVNLTAFYGKTIKITEKTDEDMVSEYILVTPSGNYHGIDQIRVFLNYQAKTENYSDILLRSAVIRFPSYMEHLEKFCDWIRGITFAGKIGYSYEFILPSGCTLRIPYYINSGPKVGFFLRREFPMLNNPILNNSKWYSDPEYPQDKLSGVDFLIWFSLPPDVRDVFSNVSESIFMNSAL